MGLRVERDVDGFRFEYDIQSFYLWSGGLSGNFYYFSAIVGDFITYGLRIVDDLIFLWSMVCKKNFRIVPLDHLIYFFDSFSTVFFTSGKTQMDYHIEEIFLEFIRASGCPLMWFAVGDWPWAHNFGLPQPTILGRDFLWGFSDTKSPFILFVVLG